MKQFTSVWNEIILLLSIKIKAEEVPQHREHLKALTAYMVTEYPGLTIGDVKLAYRLGVKYKLGIEMFAELNPRSIGKVLDAYEQFKREELGRNPIKAEAALQLPEPVPTQQQQDRANATLVRFAYQCAELKREYRDHGNLLYGWLDSKGLIPFNKERKWDFMQQAQKSIFNEEANFGVTGNSQEHKDARSLAELLKEANEAGQMLMSQKERITTRAKQIAFTALLAELIEFDTTADEFLEPILNQTEHEKTETDANDQGEGAAA